MTLLQKTKEILSDSIKSAIFIDEKAFEPYSKKPVTSFIETELSLNLYKNFKNKGISLTIHKFNQNDLSDENKINFLLKKRDLVLLDWKLDGNDGEQFSLKLLSKIVVEKHIHFCSIYTSENDYNEIINNLLSYFSGYDENYYNSIVQEIEPYLDGQNSLLEQISYDDINLNKRLRVLFNDIDLQLPKLLTDITAIKVFGEALVQVKLAFSNLQKSAEPNHTPTHLNRINNTLNINNTIITIISKNENSAIKIISKLNHQINKSENCFTQLLGLDMQNNFANNNSFIDGNLLSTNLDTLMFHRRQLNLNNSEIEFTNFIKSILLEHSKMKLENSKLKTLDETFLNRVSKNKYKIKIEEIARLNTFYNGSFVNKKENLNFGDTFKDDKGNYFLCITPLCDCIVHNGKSNIGFKYYFVKGQKIKMDKAVKTGEKGFISFINEKDSINWKLDEYIKPFQIFIPNPNINNNTISFYDWDSENNSIKNDLEYVFTLKQNYAQRITNQAFNHPVRVGVNFVKNLIL